MPRILAGRSKGRKLKAPRGQETRPTGARVRRTFFDVLAESIPGCRFLDPFAGSGAIGLEALSRGAARVVLMDRSPQAVEAMRRNIEAFRADSGEIRVWCGDAAQGLRSLAAAGDVFDVIYLDPPYDTDEYEFLLSATGNLLAQEGVVTVEHFHKRALPETIGASSLSRPSLDKTSPKRLGLTRLSLMRQCRVGDHRLSFFRRDE